MIRCHSERSEAATQSPKAFGARPGFQSLIVAADLWAAQTLRIAKRLQQRPPRYKLSLILCQGVGLGAGVSRSVLCSSVVWLVAVLAPFLDLWCVFRVVPVVVSPVPFTVCFVLLTTVSPVSFVFSPTVLAVSFVFSAAVSTPSLTVSPAFFAPCFTS